MIFNWVSLILAMIFTLITVVYFEPTTIESILIGISYGITSQI